MAFLNIQELDIMILEGLGKDFKLIVSLTILNK